ncbi:MAG: DnaJ domain-containing protein [Deltaproteobacteria bacterium]|nr:DnaJ domain-containing protein [Deltaproteobacteria bacterium]
MHSVLVVEDDPLVGAELAAELEIRGYDVDWVRDAQSGAPEVRRDKAPRVLIVDFYLPKGDGISLIEKWKEQDRPPSVILLSGADVTDELQERLPKNRQPERVFTKPIGLSVIVDAVRELAPQGRRAPDGQGDVAGESRRTGLLPELLWYIAKGHRSGLLVLDDVENAAIVHVRHGDPVFVESGSLDETLGRLLLREGALSQGQYQEALRRMTDDLVQREDIRFGEIVVSMGFCSAEIVFATLRTQVCEKLVNLFHRRSQLAEFREGNDEVMLGVAFRVDALKVILDGIRRHYGPDQLQPVVTPRERRYAALAQSFSEIRPRMPFTTLEERFLVKLRGDKVIRDILDQCGLERTHAMQVLYALHVVEALELSSEPIPRTPRNCRPKRARRATPTPTPPASVSKEPAEEVLARHLKVSGRSHYEILDVPKDASAVDIEQAFRRLSEKYSPDRLADTPLGEAHERATELWAQIVLAHETLRDPPKRERYDRSQRITVGHSPQEKRRRREEFLAEAAFQRGLAELAADRVLHAVLELANARALAPHEPEYACYEIWARCLQAIETGADMRATAQEARARMEAALVDKRPRPRALYAIALSCQVLEDHEAAREHLRAALSFDPDFAEARNLLKSLGNPFSRSRADFRDDSSGW